MFEVTDTQKQGVNLFLHKGKLISGTLNIGQLCDAKVSVLDRKATELNHSATHLLHAALRQILGDHVNQKVRLLIQSVYALIFHILNLLPQIK